MRFQKCPSPSKGFLIFSQALAPTLSEPLVDQFFITTPRGSLFHGCYQSLSVASNSVIRLASDPSLLEGMQAAKLTQEELEIETEIQTEISSDRKSGSHRTWRFRH